MKFLDSSINYPIKGMSDKCDSQYIYFTLKLLAYVCLNYLKLLFGAQREKTK
jgi:hypothetical protein